MNVLELLRELSETPGPSGYEAGIAAVIHKNWNPLVDQIATDRIGSLVARKNGSGQEFRPSILLAAHMDEIGLMVKKIISDPEDDESGNGFLRVTNVGGVDIRHLYNQTVVVHGSKQRGSKGKDRQLKGVIGSLPGRMLPEPRQNKPFDYDDLVIDLGMPINEVRERIAVGDIISFRQPLRKLLNGRVSGKSFDNRASVAAVTVCLDYLQRREHAWDVIAVATAQEETALLGAYTSAFAHMPDLAVAVDVTFGKGPGATDDQAYDLDGGPALGLGPNVHPGVYNALKDTAKALEMTIQTDPHTRYSGTDAVGLQIAREGVPTGLVSIPIRYMHTMVETLAINDIERTGRLLGEFIVRLDGKFLDKLAADLIKDK